MDLNTSRLYQDEKSLQSAWFNYYKNNCSWDFNSLEEGMVADYSKPEMKNLQEHQFLIVSDLKIAIENLNKKLYEEHKDDLAVSEANFYQTIFDHVVSMYAIATTQTEVAINYALHQYIFSKGIKLGFTIIERKIEVKKGDGSSLFLNYSLMGNKYNTLGNENVFRLVKEKKIKTTGLQTKDSEQYPDFAIYINGLPAYVVEFKTSAVSWKEAWKDYKTKPSYHVFWACIGVDGVRAFISATYNSSNEPRLWAKYGKRKDQDSYGAKDIADELICNKHNLVFYAYSCLHAVEEHYQSSKRTERFLEALSVQQYYTVYAASQRFEMLTMQKGSGDKVDNLKEVVKHVQRSGKSKTIRAIVTALFTFHNGLYSKVYIQVPDTTIRNQFLNKTFGSSFIVNIGSAIEIHNQDQYIRSITSSEKGLYIMNMQKISEDAAKHTNKNRDVLIILDEVHTHQLGENFQIRLENFPNASYISFTATPRIVAHNKKVINMTNTVYAGGKNEYMDEFTSADAIDNNVIIPIIYEKASYMVSIDDDVLKKIDDEIYSVVKNKLDTPTSGVWQDYSDKIEDKLYKAADVSMITPDEMEKRRVKEIKDFVDRSKEALIRQLYREIKIEGNSKKIEWIVQDIKKKREDVFSDQSSKEQYFKTKSFWVVDDIEMATEIICGIKKQYGSCVVDGIRFAVDYSFVSTSDKSTVGVHKRHFPQLYEKIDESGVIVSTGYALASLDELNCVPVGSEPILDEFSTQADGSVDVLIIVGKYIMGYDNPNLVAVYCDTEFNEISRIYQLATRPATKRENKKCGYFVDLGLGGKNSTAYKNAVKSYESEDENITTFVLDDDVIVKLNGEIKLKLEEMAQIIGATYPEDFKNLNQLDICLENLGASNLKSKSSFFIKLTEINRLLKKLAIPSNYPDHKQALSVLGIAVGNFFELLKAKEDDVIRFTKDDLRQEINSLFVSLGFSGGVKDVLDYQIKYAKELMLSDVNLERAKVNKSLIMLKSRIDSHDQYVNASIYDGIKEMIRYCEQTSSLDVKKQILARIESVRAEHQKQREALNAMFDSPYERVVDEMFMAWINGVGLGQVWAKETYSGMVKRFSQEIASYFEIHSNNVNGPDLKQKLYTRYTPIWSEVLGAEKDFVENERFVEFRERVISFKNKGVDNQDLIEFFDKLIETLILTFEELKGVEYV